MKIKIIVALLVIANILAVACKRPDSDTPAEVQRQLYNRRLDFIDDTAANVRCYLAHGEMDGYVSGKITTISCVHGVIR